MAELKKAVWQIQNDIAGNIPSSNSITNSDVIKCMQIDLIIREAAKKSGNSGWNGDYFNGNLGSMGGGDVITKTKAYIGLLDGKNATDLFTGPDFALRNPKHIFDEVTDAFVADLLPLINALF